MKQESKKRSRSRLRSWGEPGRLSGAMLERFSSEFGASGVAFWSHIREVFLSLKRSVEPARARGVPSGTPAQNAERGRGARPRSLARMLPCCRCSSVVSCLQCLQLSERTRFPFHDSQVSFRTPKAQHNVRAPDKSEVRESGPTDSFPDTENGDAARRAVARTNKVREREGRQPELNMSSFKERIKRKCKHFPERVFGKGWKAAGAENKQF